LTSQEQGAQINIRDEPSTSAYAQHYGFAGDQVQILKQATDADGQTWYQVQFNESSAIGWVRGDFIELGQSEDNSQPEEKLPIRDAVTGKCDCPYDLTKNGQLCGGRSAYSRPGGKNPICYTTDQ